MKLLVSGLKSAKNIGDVSDLLSDKKFISQLHWEAINAAEVAAGEPLGKPRRKMVTRKDLFKITIN
jgi:ferredoxin--NADP+ reductase